MSVDERSRHQLHVRLEELLGPEAAATMMSHLPPVGWADVATKRDLDALGERMDLRIDALANSIDLRFAATKSDLQALGDSILATMRGEMVSQTRTMVFALMTAVLSSVSVVLAASRLT